MLPRSDGSTFSSSSMNFLGVNTTTEFLSKQTTKNRVIPKFSNNLKLADGLYEVEKFSHEVMDDNSWEFNEPALRPSDKSISQSNAVPIKPKKVRLKIAILIFIPRFCKFVSKKFQFRPIPN